MENGVYCLLRALYTREAIKYWRTKQKTEIDFIVELYPRRIPIEAKLSYPRSIGNLVSFLDRYKERKAWIVSLEKLQFYERDKRIKCVYPWEIYAII